jgi:hypothetical protein
MRLSYNFRMPCNDSRRTPRERRAPRPRARSRRFHGRVYALVAHALVGLGFSAIAAAQAGSSQAPPPIASGEIYLDLTSRRFSAPIRAEKGAAVKIAVHAPPESQVVLAYWPTRRDCPQGENLEQVLGALGTDRRNVEYRAGAPREASGGVQKYVIDVGPLRILDTYCFYATVSRQKPLDESERDRVDAAMSAAIRAVMTPGQAPAPGCNARGAAIRVCQLGAEFEKNLGALSHALVLAPGGGEPVPIRQAFEELILASDEVRVLVEDALQAVETESLSTEALRAQLASLRTAVEGWDGGAAYDPLWRIDPLAIPSAGGKPARFSSFVRDDELKKRFPRNVLRDKKEFLRVAWDARDALQEGEGDAAAREPLQDPEQEGQLQAFLDHPTQPPMITITAGRVLSLVSTMQARAVTALGPDIDAMKKLFPEGIADAVALSGLPGFGSDDPRNARLVVVMSAQQALADAFGDLEEAQRDQAALRDSTAIQAFRDALQEVQLSEKRGEMQYAPTFTERFPLSVGADLGLGFAFFDEDRRDAFTYFGLAIYAAPLYKEEPLAGADWRRKASLVLGITLNSPSLNDDVRVSGLIGNRMLLAGGGWRFNEYMRLGVGSLLFRQNAANPLSSRATMRAGLYASLSLDLDVIGIVAGWFGQAASSLK